MCNPGTFFCDGWDFYDELVKLSMIILYSLNDDSFDWQLG